MRWLTDPKIINYIIMVLYGLNAARWGIEWARGGGWGDCAYWLAALAITLSVTFGYKR